MALLSILAGVLRPLGRLSQGHWDAIAFALLASILGFGLGHSSGSRAGLIEGEAAACATAEMEALRVTLADMVAQAEAALDVTRTLREADRATRAALDRLTKELDNDDPDLAGCTVPDRYLRLLDDIAAQGDRDAGGLPAAPGSVDPATGAPEAP